MEVSSVSSSDTMISAVTDVDLKRASLQMALLRKTLNAEQQQAAELQRMMEGKGENLDIRV